MNGKPEQDQISRQRAQAVKTAWIVGAIAILIFAVFVGSAMFGH
jgi:uncharacterized integral membrane protein